MIVVRIGRGLVGVQHVGPSNGQSKKREQLLSIGVGVLRGELASACQLTNA